MLILDLCCGAGGVAMGLHKAFPQAEIVGFDIKPQQHYPFLFLKCDATKIPVSELRKADLIWASPPCQGFSRDTPKSHRGNYPDLVDVFRKMLVKSGKPWIIENVPCSPVKPYVRLTGLCFGKPYWRERYFETSHLVISEFPQYKRTDKGIKFNFTWHAERGKLLPTKENLSKFMEIDWMTVREMEEAIPPIYSYWLGEKYKEVLGKNESQQRKNFRLK